MSDSIPSSIHRQLAFVHGEHGSHVYFGAADGAPDIIATITDTEADAAQPAPATQWCIRVTYPGFLPPIATAIEIATKAGLQVEAIADGPAGQSHWLLTGHHSRIVVDAAATRLRKAHRVKAVAFRRIPQ
jgi:hypothetical protein